MRLQLFFNPLFQANTFILHTLKYAYKQTNIINADVYDQEISILPGRFNLKDLNAVFPSVA